MRAHLSSSLSALIDERAIKTGSGSGSLRRRPLKHQDGKQQRDAAAGELRASLFAREAAAVSGVCELACASDDLASELVSACSSSLAVFWGVVAAHLSLSLSLSLCQKYGGSSARRLSSSSRAICLAQVESEKANELARGALGRPTSNGGGGGNER